MRLFPVLLLLLATSLACATPTTDIDTAANAASSGQDTDGTADEHEGDDAGECSDAADNDRDGMFDCDDGECAASPDCQVAAVDADADGFTPENGDCDDNDASVNPGAVEVACTGIDEDCNSASLDGVDSDADGANECDDCDDDNPQRAPNFVEVTCNGLDDDCNAVTDDSPDGDGDGDGLCDDCDDGDAAISSGASEVCDDHIDNNCDGELDEGCTYSGTYDLDTAVTYTCGFGLIGLDFGQFSVKDTYPTITVTTVGTGVTSVAMAGSFSSASNFDAAKTLSGTCDETYSLTANFTSPDEFVGTFTASYTPASKCSAYGCEDQSWSVHGTK